MPSPPLANGDYDLDLEVGSDKFLAPSKSIGINELLEWIIDAKPQNLDGFVCWRGLLTNILATPFCRWSKWSFGAVLFRGAIYLCEFKDPVKTTGIGKKYSYMGLKFETYMVRDSPAAAAAAEPPQETPGINFFLFSYRFCMHCAF